MSSRLLFSMFLAIVIASADQVRTEPHPEQGSKAESITKVGALTVRSHERAGVKTGTDDWRQHLLSCRFAKRQSQCVRSAFDRISGSLMTSIASGVSAKLQL